MYFVNRSEIEDILDYYHKVLDELTKSRLTPSQLFEQLALERGIHVMVESVLDVGNKMIDGFIMRDPGSYYDIIDILIDESVLPTEEEKSYKRLIDARQMLTKDYEKVNHKFLLDILKEEVDVLQKFEGHVRTYLDNELGVANAFANEPDRLNDGKGK